MTQEVRACVFCANAEYQEPYAYESCSGGDEWTCKANMWPAYPETRTIDMVDECAYQRALNCPHFALADKFKKEKAA